MVAHSFRRWLDATQLGVREHVAKFHADRVRHANPIASAKLRRKFLRGREVQEGRSFAANARLAPRAGFEPATIRLTVECSTAELPRNRRKPCSQPQRITKPPGLCKARNGPFSRGIKRIGNRLRGHDSSPFGRPEDAVPQTRRTA